MRFGRISGVPFGVQWLFEGEGTPGGGSPSGGAPGGGAGKEPGQGPGDDLFPGEGRPRRENPADVLGRFGGDAVRIAAKLSDVEYDAYRSREKLRDKDVKLQAAQQEIERLKGQLPKEGAVILTGDDARNWETFKALGDPAQVKEKVEKFDTVLQENSTIKRDQLLRDVADRVGPGQAYKFTVLRELDAKVPGLNYEFKQVEENGQKVERVYVKFKDGEGESAPVKEMPLTEYASKQWADFLPALETQPATAAVESGARVVVQAPAHQGGGGNMFDTIRKNAETKNQQQTQSGPSLEERFGIAPRSATVVK